MVIETSPSQNLGSGAWPRAARWEGNRLDPQQSSPDQGFGATGTYGKGKFPGYAINVNTGERLNIFFGESSWDVQNNGNDMMWNPTNDNGSGGTSVGGRHFIWVTDQLYDGCAALYNSLANGTASPTNNTSFFFPSTGNFMDSAYQHIAYVGLPLVESDHLFDNPLDIPTTARVSIRLNQPWRSRAGTTDNPVFTFNTTDFAAEINQREIAVDALENIRVVPNPYYAYSRYESSQLQTLVKITNLPQQCTIKIFTLNGTLVRTFKKDSDEPEQLWDLKNHTGVPVASGVYIIHVDAGDLGEKIVKFFGVLPQIDLESF